MKVAAICTDLSQLVLDFLPLDVHFTVKQLLALVCLLGISDVRRDTVLRAKSTAQLTFSLKRYQISYDVVGVGRDHALNLIVVVLHHKARSESIHIDDDLSRLSIRISKATAQP